MKTKVYDKVSWHYPEGAGCPNLEAAKEHFVSIMKWLGQHNLLTADGKEAYEAGVDSEFAIISDMLTHKGNELFSRYYSQWLNLLSYDKPSSLDFWNEKCDGP